VDRNGRQFVSPIQAKGGNDQLSVVQTKQDLACCTEKYPDLISRAISAQFMEDDLIAYSSDSGHPFRWEAGHLSGDSGHLTNRSGATRLFWFLTPSD
jgi:hypothetical protein